MIEKSLLLTKSFSLSPQLMSELAPLFDLRTIRSQCQKIRHLCQQQGKTHFHLHEERLQEVADKVIEVCNENYPQGNIPGHERWQHFQVGGKDRMGALEKKILAEAEDTKEDLPWIKAQMDIILVSVLLDAGAGSSWRYQEKGSSTHYNSSEGLAVASLAMFEEGLFSSNSWRYQVDGIALQNLQLDKVGEGLLHSEDNPLQGLSGRVELLQSLGKVLTSHPQIFGEKCPRFGNLLDYLKNHYESQNGVVEVRELFSFFLYLLAPIWRGRATYKDFPLGDVWTYPPLGKMQQLVPFHKLSQWLFYSLLRPLRALGLNLRGEEDLTGLAEYRNGGLFLDYGVLTLKDPAWGQKAWEPDAEIIVEWRALTVSLLDQVAAVIREKKKQTVETLPLAQILEGGTWWAGRKIARQLRPGGGPPLTIKSDGTVF